MLTALPATVHIGPVRDARPGAREARAPYQPTLVFDVDIRDYAPYRPCCGATGAACTRCWPVAAFAQAAVGAFVRACGLGTPYCFFSGSKGVHVWVAGRPDRAALVAGEGARRALVAFFHSVKHWPAADAAGYAIPPRQAAAALDFVQAALGSEEDRRRLTTFVCDDMGLRAAYRDHEAVNGRDSALVQVLWPRLDADVTAAPAHMLKAPLNVHATTGRACVWLESPAVDPYAADIDPALNAAALAAALGCV